MNIPVGRASAPAEMAARDGRPTKIWWTYGTFQDSSSWAFAHPQSMKSHFLCRDSRPGCPFWAGEGACPCTK